MPRISAAARKVPTRLLPTAGYQSHLGAGWTPARAAVSVTANKAGTFKVASESYVNGYLDNMELYSPADSVDWSTNVEEKDVEVVGPDLYTGS